MWEAARGSVIASMPLQSKCGGAGGGVSVLGAVHNNPDVGGGSGVSHRQYAVT